MTLTREPVQLAPPISLILAPEIGVSVPEAKIPVGVTLLSLNTLPEIKPSVLIVKVELAGCWLLPKSVTSEPAGILLVCTPEVLPVTVTLIVQPPTGIVLPLASVMVPAPASAVMAPTPPPHVLATPGVV